MVAKPRLSFCCRCSLSSHRKPPLPNKPATAALPYPKQCQTLHSLLHKESRCAQIAELLRCSAKFSLKSGTLSFVFSPPITSSASYDPLRFVTLLSNFSTFSRVELPPIFTHAAKRWTSVPANSSHLPSHRPERRSPPEPCSRFSALRTSPQASFPPFFSLFLSEIRALLAFQPSSQAASPGNRNFFPALALLLSNRRERSPLSSTPSY